MFPGHCTLCIPSKDLMGSRAFYEALGMVTTNAHDLGVSLTNGDLHIYLMGFDSTLSFNFRGSDVFEVEKRFHAAGFEPDGKLFAREADPSDTMTTGTSWMTHDPDGTAIFFDTNGFDISARGVMAIQIGILEGTEKQLINLGAPAETRDAWDAKIMTPFVTDEARKMGRKKVQPLTEDGHFAGHFTWCLAAKDTAHTRKFYEAMDLETGEPSSGDHIHMGTSFCDIDLMSFLPGNCFNFRGADVFRLYEQMTAAGLELEGEPERYSKEEFGQPGAHWKTKDPEGNVVYFDTTDPELIEPGDASRITGLFERTCRQLNDSDADETLIAAIQTEFM